MNDIKQALISSLSSDIPDFNFMQKAEVLDVFPILLEEMLEQEKEDFLQKLKMKNSEIDFEAFEEESKLWYLFGILHHLDNVSWSEKTRQIIENFEPKYIEFWNEIAYSQRYYEMLKICHKNNAWDEEQNKILKDAIKAYEVRGIHLNEEKQKRLKEIQADLSRLSRKFSENALLSEESLWCFINNEDDIQDMPADQKRQALDAGKSLWKNWYQFWSSISEYVSLMKYCTSKEIRKNIYLERSMIASHGEHDNRRNVLEILRLRQEKAKILWFSDYCELSLFFKMADSPEEVLKTLGEISLKAKEKALQEQKKLQEHFGLDSIDAEDTAFYFRKYKEEKYQIHEDQLRQYFEYESVMSWMFSIMSELYDLEIHKREWESGAQYSCYEIYRRWELLSYFIVDPFYRPEKRSWAWANILKEKYKWSIPVITNVYNINKWETVTLLKLSEVETLFHEFGHAMHEMFSSSRYSDLSGFHVERDFVELPSQFHEHFCNSPEWLTKVGIHYKTAERIPQELVDKLQKIDHLDSWNVTLWQCVYAWLDMLIHANKSIDDVDTLDEYILSYINEISLYKKPKEYKMYCSFSHIFDGWYAAWYYSYMWSEILELDVWAEFKKSGAFNKGVAQKFYDTILSQWAKKSWRELFQDFCGREMSLDGFFEAKWI